MTKKNLTGLILIALFVLTGSVAVQAEGNKDTKRKYTDGSEANKPGKRAGHSSEEHGYGVTGTSTDTYRSTGTPHGSSGRPSDPAGSGSAK